MSNKTTPKAKDGVEPEKLVLDVPASSKKTVDEYGYPGLRKDYDAYVQYVGVGAGKSFAGHPQIIRGKPPVLVPEHQISSYVGHPCFKLTFQKKASK